MSENNKPRQDRLIDKIGRVVVIPQAFIEDMPNLPICAHSLFLYLLSRRGKDEEKNLPTYDTIEKGTGMSPPTIRKGIKALEQHGWIILKPRNPKPRP